MSDEKEAKRSIKSEQIRMNAERISELEKKIEIFEMHNKYGTVEQIFNNIEEMKKTWDQNIEGVIKQTLEALDKRDKEIAELRELIENRSKDGQRIIDEFEEQLNELKELNKRNWDRILAFEDHCDTWSPPRKCNKLEGKKGELEKDLNAIGIFPYNKATDGSGLKLPEKKLCITCGKNEPINAFYKECEGCIIEHEKASGGDLKEKMIDYGVAGEKAEFILPDEKPPEPIDEKLYEYCSEQMDMMLEDLDKYGKIRLDPIEEPEPSPCCKNCIKKGHTLDYCYLYSMRCPHDERNKEKQPEPVKFACGHCGKEFICYRDEDGIQTGFCPDCKLKQDTVGLDERVRDATRQELISEFAKKLRKYLGCEKCTSTGKPETCKTCCGLYPIIEEYEDKLK